LPKDVGSERPDQEGDGAETTQQPQGEGRQPTPGGVSPTTPAKVLVDNGSVNVDSGQSLCQDGLERVSCFDYHCEPLIIDDLGGAPCAIPPTPSPWSMRGTRWPPAWSPSIYKDSIHGGWRSPAPLHGVAENHSQTGAFGFPSITDCTTRSSLGLTDGFADPAKVSINRIEGLLEVDSDLGDGRLLNSNDEDPLHCLPACLEAPLNVEDSSGSHYMCVPPTPSPRQAVTSSYARWMMPTQANKTINNSADSNDLQHRAPFCNALITDGVSTGGEPSNFHEPEMQVAYVQGSTSCSGAAPARERWTDVPRWQAMSPSTSRLFNDGRNVRGTYVHTPATPSTPVVGGRRRSHSMPKDS